MYGDVFLMCLFSFSIQFMMDCLPGLVPSEFGQFLHRVEKEAELTMLCGSTLLQQVPQTCVQMDSGRPRLSVDDE